MTKDNEQQKSTRQSQNDSVELKAGLMPFEEINIKPMDITPKGIIHTDNALGLNHDNKITGASK